MAEPHLQKAGPVDGDKVLLAVLAHAHVALLPAVLLHHCCEDLGPLLEGYKERRMPAHQQHRGCQCQCQWHLWFTLTLTTSYS